MLIRAGGVPWGQGYGATAGPWPGLVLASSTSVLAGLRLLHLWLPRAQDQPTVGWMGPELWLLHIGSSRCCCGSGHGVAQGLGTSGCWHLSPGTFCCHQGLQGSRDVAGLISTGDLRLPVLASAKRVCYIFNILRALLVGI